MNSYINLVLDAEGAKERLQSIFQVGSKREIGSLVNPALDLQKHRSIRVFKQVIKPVIPAPEVTGHWVKEPWLAPQRG
jgi:hypothetical protein